MYEHNEYYRISSPEADVIGAYHEYASKGSKVPVFVVIYILRVAFGCNISVSDLITPGPKARVRKIETRDE